MSHEYSDTPKIRVDSTGHRYVELPVDGTQRLELAPGSAHHNGSVAVAAEANHATPPHYTQDTLDAGLDSPFFPAPKTSKEPCKQDNSSVARHHREDIEKEV